MRTVNKTVPSPHPVGKHSHKDISLNQLLGILKVRLGTYAEVISRKSTLSRFWGNARGSPPLR